MTIRRYVPALILAAGAAVLVWLYWPVIVTGTIGFIAVRKTLLRHRSSPGFFRHTLPRWVEVAAVWRGAGRLGR